MLNSMLIEAPPEIPASRSIDGVGLNALLLNIADGNRADLKALYQATSPRLFAIIVRMVRRREVAEDLLQETFVSIWCKAHQFDASRGNALAWLYAIARRKAIDRLRMSNREDPGLFEDVALEDSPFELSIDPVDPETKISIQRSLNTLKPDHHRAIRLCYAYGFTHEQLATYLNVPLGTAKSWVKGGLEQLKLSMTNRGNGQEIADLERRSEKEESCVGN